MFVTNLFFGGFKVQSLTLFFCSRLLLIIFRGFKVQFLTLILLTLVTNIFLEDLKSNF